MRKTLEQIILEGQAAKCSSLEELYLLWQLMQQMEENPFGSTCQWELDPRNFHIDGILSREQYNGTLYILKETNMKRYIKKGQTMPVICDVRPQLLSGKSPSGEVEYSRYLTGMQRILDGETKESTISDAETRSHFGVLYLNKRGGKGMADEIGINYGMYYIEFIKRQIALLAPKTIICCGEDIFRLIVMEVFRNKKEKKNQEIYMKWKDVIQGDVFYADTGYRPAREWQKAAVRVVRMWSPAYRVNNGQHVSLEEYLKEFERRSEKVVRNVK